MTKSSDENVLSRAVTQPNIPIAPILHHIDPTVFVEVVTEGLNEFIDLKEGRQRAFGKIVSQWLPTREPPEFLEWHTRLTDRLLDLYCEPETPSNCSDEDSPEMMAAKEKREEIARIHKALEDGDWQEEVDDERPPQLPSLNTSSQCTVHDASATHPYPATPDEDITEARGGKRKRSSPEKTSFTQPPTNKRRKIVTDPPNLRRSARLMNATKRTVQVQTKNIHNTNPTTAPKLPQSARSKHARKKSVQPPSKKIRNTTPGTPPNVRRSERLKMARMQKYGG